MQERGRYSPREREIRASPSPRRDYVKLDNYRESRSSEKYARRPEYTPSPSVSPERRNYDRKESPKRREIDHYENRSVSPKRGKFLNCYA